MVIMKDVVCGAVQAFEIPIDINAVNSITKTPVIALCSLHAMLCK